MSVSSVNIDSLRTDIGKLFLSDHLIQKQYDDLFYQHLTALMKFRMLNPEYKGQDNFKINEKNYLGLEQYIFDHTNIVENESGGQIDWNLIDEAKDILRGKIKTLLKQEGNSEYLKPIVNFTVDSYENWIMYKQLHPNSISNPWIPTTGILQNGYIYLASDKRDLIDTYNKKVYSNAEDETRGNLGIIAKSSKEREFSGFLVDNRQSVQMLVFEFLKREASGMHNAKGTRKISEFLVKQKIRMSEQAIRTRITIPLKRAGLIGSSTTGFFFINSVDDLIQAYKHHKGKMRAIQKTLDLYKEKGRQWGVEDLDIHTFHGLSDIDL
jgi:hypothetical protein